MQAVVVLFLVCLSVATGQSTLTYTVTVRDFLPVSCMPIADLAP